MEIRTDEFIPMLLLNELTDWQRNSVKINFTAYACHQRDVTKFLQDWKSSYGFTWHLDLNVLNVINMFSIL